jgi:hypothetical protein
MLVGTMQAGRPRDVSAADGPDQDGALAMQNPSTPDRHSAYFGAMRDADAALDDALGHVRAEEDAGRITPAEAAAERVGLLERHIAECQRLRRELPG